MQRDKGDQFLLCTGFCLNTKILTDKSFLKSIFKNLPQIIGMNAIREPIISEAKNNPGLEGYVPVDTSNITISTYANNPRFVACVHSCNEFDYEKVLAYLKKKYDCSDMKFLSCRETDFDN